jgi:NCAIR mutase (PurE)-related protein
MNTNSLNHLLKSVAKGKMSVEDATKKLTHISFEDIDYAHIDHNRSLRKGFPEVIFGQGKSTDQIIGIMERMALQENIILVTRISRKKAEKVISRFKDAAYHNDAKMIIWGKNKTPKQGKGMILVISAGTSDIPVA